MSAVSADRGPQAPVPVETLAAREGVSRVWAEPVMASLRRAGIAASSRGAHGGFVLARRTEQISPGEVLEGNAGSGGESGVATPARDRWMPGARGQCASWRPWTCPVAADEVKTRK